MKSSMPCYFVFIFVISYFFVCFLFSTHFLQGNEGNHHKIGSTEKGTVDARKLKFRPTTEINNH